MGQDRARWGGERGQRRGRRWKSRSHRAPGHELQLLLHQPKLLLDQLLNAGGRQCRTGHRGPRQGGRHRHRWSGGDRRRRRCRAEIGSGGSVETMWSARQSSVAISSSSWRNPMETPN